jgi:hypothetical protein
MDDVVIVSALRTPLTKVSSHRASFNPCVPSGPGILALEGPVA